MRIKNTSEQYGSLTKLLHWVMAIIVIGMLTVGLIMVDMDLTPDKFRLYGWHKSFGATILALVTLRFIWRLINAEPDLPATMKKIEQRLAHIAHWLLYALMFFMPISGWLMSSSTGFPVSVFGWFLLPDLVQADKEQAKLFADLHEIGAWSLIVVASLHILAALKHHFYDKDNIMKRMLPFVKSAILLLCFTLTTEGYTKPLKMIADKSSIDFVATVNNAPSKGSFKTFDAEIDFDPEDLEHSYVKVTVDILSVDSVYAEVASNLLRSEWFNTEKYTTATFETESFKHVDGNKYKAVSHLTIRGQKHPLILNFTLDNPTSITGTTTIKRTDFNVGEGAWKATDIVADEVTVNIHVEAK